MPLRYGTILLETEAKKKDSFSREQYVKRQFDRSNQGKLNMEGIKRLAAMLENGNVRYMDFPSWVLQTYIDPSQNGAIPLKHNKWLDVKSIVNTSTEINLEDITYGGFVVDGQRKRESGIDSVNVVRSGEVDILKYVRLLLFKRAVIEAKKLIEHKQQRQGQQMQQTGGAMGQPTAEMPPPTEGPSGGAEMGPAQGPGGEPAVEPPSSGAEHTAQEPQPKQHRTRPRPRR